LAVRGYARRCFLELAWVAAILCLTPRANGNAAGRSAVGTRDDRMDAWDDAARWDDRRRMPERR
jgi:hypothetical protein